MRDATMDIVVTNLQSAQVDVTFVRDVLVRALRLEGYRQPPDVGVALVDDGYIRVLNREYRGGDYATDVLAFPIDAEVYRPGAPGTAPGTEDAMLGDIVISVERAREQARQFKHPLRREVALLAIHGLLHLLGYDDETEAAASAMWARQKELLETILGDHSSTSSPPRGDAQGRQNLRPRLRPRRDTARDPRR